MEIYIQTCLLTYSFFTTTLSKELMLTQLVLAREMEPFSLGMDCVKDVVVEYRDLVMCLCPDNCHKSVSV